MPLALVTDPTWVFFVVLMIILFSPILLRRLRTPHIIGLILAGVMIGQHGFNVIERDRSFEIFGQVGIYFIMFLASLEMNMGSVRQYGRKGFLQGFRPHRACRWEKRILFIAFCGTQLFAVLLPRCYPTTLPSYRSAARPIMGKPATPLTMAS